jgi:2-polyprenyl-6-hydroxyphenyl methylase/3-demethylubiquinone-9 3-methyltransferase
VQLRPSWRFAEIYGSFDVLTVSDVVHHVPAQERPRFFADIVAVARRTDCRTIIIKDVEPGGLRAKLAEWADHFITGDRQVRLLAPNQIVLPGYRCVEVAMPDYPNYCLRFVLVST